MEKLEAARRGRIIQEVAEHKAKLKAKLAMDTELAANTAQLNAKASVCAKCGIRSTDNKAFSKCSACKMVTYCSRECQKDHWGEHKRICKLHVSAKKAAAAAPL